VHDGSVLPVSADRRLMSMIAAAASPVVVEMIVVCACFANVFMSTFLNAVSFDVRIRYYPYYSWHLATRQN